MNWIDDDGMIGSHRGRSAVAVRWDWIDLGWMEHLGSTAIVPRDLADEEMSEGGAQGHYLIPKVTFVLLLPLPSNYPVRMEWGHRGAEAHRQVPANATITPRGLGGQRDGPPGDVAVVAFPDDQDAVEEGAKASRAEAERPAGGN